MKNNYQEKIMSYKPLLLDGVMGNSGSSVLSFPKVVIGNLLLTKMKKYGRSPKMEARRVGDDVPVEAVVLRAGNNPAGRRGFTLIELLVVVLIIGILSAVALPQYTAAVQKARMSEGVMLGKSMITAQQAYFLANNEYTADPDRLDLDIPVKTLKNFTYDIQFVSNPACSHLDLHARNNSFGNIWITSYFQDGSVNCAADKSSAPANSFCARHSSDRRDCYCEPSYNCYRID